MPSLVVDMEARPATTAPAPARVVVRAVRVGVGRRPRALERDPDEDAEFTVVPGVVDFGGPVARILVDVEVPAGDGLAVNAPFPLREVPVDDPGPRVELERTGRGWYMVTWLSDCAARVIVRPPDAVWRLGDVRIAVGSGTFVLR